MDESAIQELRQRLDRLEREKRWWRAVGAVALALCVLLALLMGFARKCW